MLMEKGLKYGLNVPVLAAILLLVSLVLYGHSSKGDVCEAYDDVASDLQYSYASTDMFRDANIESLADEAKNYSADSDVQQDGKDLEEAHGDTYTLYGIASATSNIAVLCGYSINID